MDRYALFRFFARVRVTAMPQWQSQSTKPHGQPVAPTATAAGKGKGAAGAGQPVAPTATAAGKGKGDKGTAAGGKAGGEGTAAARGKGGKGRKGRKEKTPIGSPTTRSGEGQPVAPKEPVAPDANALRRLRRKTVDAIRASSSGEAGRAADRLETCTSACGEAARASASGEARQTAERVTTCASASGEAVRASGDAAPLRPVAKQSALPRSAKHPVLQPVAKPGVPLTLFRDQRVQVQGECASKFRAFASGYVRRAL